MNKKLVSITLLLGAMSTISAQTQDTTFISGLEEQTLGEITVTASNSSIDRKLIFPTEQQKENSTNGVDLLQRLMLPKVQVNPLLKTVSLASGGELQLRINGVKAEIQDIAALLPADIIRIEFHDNPGLRYGNAEVVLNYIVRRYETGGSVGVNLTDAVNTWWGDNSVNGRINHKKSEFSASYDIAHRNFHQMWRDNEEIFHFADGTTLHRKEDGEPGHAEMYWQNLKTAYSYQTDKQMFNATFRYHYGNQPHFDYHGLLYDVEHPENAVRMIDNSSEKMFRPALDLYYQHNMKNDQTLVFNIVGTYISTENVRVYQEKNLDDVLLTNVKNGVVGKKYSVIGEGIYEKKMGSNSITAGLRHTQSYSNNKYENASSEMNQSESYLFGEFKGNFKKLNYTLGVGVTRSYIGQQGEASIENYTFNPRVALRYALRGESSIRLRSEVTNISPSLSNLNAIDQEIDSWQIRRGNPNLKSHLRSYSELVYELQKGIFYGSLKGAYEYQPNAIMDEKYLEGNKIIQTWNNQKDWQWVHNMLSLRVGPIKKIVQFSANVGFNHFISRGRENIYLHTYTNWFYDVGVSASYKKFSAMAQINNSWDWFYGETMSGGEKNMLMLMLGYQHKDISVNVGIMNP
ncbi:MAG: TonB-dependent receptor, partial [Prevotellaceae bacterium]|nr:TonB-dependent receptor [Prevotellaceae bacterium]